MSTARPAFPEPLLTERLQIGAWQPEFAEELNSAIRETFDDLHKWMEWADHIPTLEETESRITLTHRKFQEREDFGVMARMREGGQLAVVARLHPRDWNVPRFEIGYWCRAEFQGKGYVTETVLALSRVGFEVFGANRLEIRCDVENTRSRRVAERCGYTLEGVLRNECINPQGKLRDTMIFARLPQDVF